MSASEGHLLATKDGEQKDDESCSNGATSKSQYQQQQRRRRNPAVLIRWIEEHPYNPYPTKSEKHYLAFYSGMTQRQLNDWFANARRNIKKVGYESWKKKHSGFSAILSGIPLQGANFPVQTSSQPLLSTSPNYKLPIVSNVYSGTATVNAGVHTESPQVENDCNISTTPATHPVPSYYPSLTGMKFVQLSHGPASYTSPAGMPQAGDNFVRPAAVQTPFPFPWGHSSYKINASMHNSAGPCACSQCQPLPYQPLSRASDSASPPNSEDTSQQYCWSPASSLSASEAPPYGYTQGPSLTTTPLIQTSAAGSQWKSPDSALKVHRHVNNDETDGSTTDEGYYDDSAIQS